MNVDELVEYFREIHENQHKIWFTIEEIEKIIKEYEKNRMDIRTTQ
jgi:hypothetical protein